MELSLSGDVAVVIGGARGIGRAIVEAFVKEGALVAILDIVPETEETSKTSAWCCHCDITDYTALQLTATRISQEMGSCNHLVVAAGVGSGKYGFPFWNLAPSDWGRVLDVNLMGVVNAAHAFAPQMVEQKRGSMLFLASVAGQMGSQTDPPYSAAKAAVINFSQCAAKDLAPFGVRVNCLSPGMVKTELNRSVWQAWNSRQKPSDQLDYEDWATAKVQRVSPLGKWQAPQELAAMAVYLASPHACNITGQTLNVDGGQVMHA